MIMTPVEILRAARAKVAQGWTQGADGRDIDGRPSYMSGEPATCWCVSGAIHSVSRAHWYDPFVALDCFRKAAGCHCEGIADWNDAHGRTQAEVLAAFDRAIELAEKQ